MVPPEEGKYRLRDNDDEETSLPILPSGSCGITLTESDIATLHREGITFDGNNDPYPENFMNSDDVLPPPLSLTFGFS